MPSTLASGFAIAGASMKLLTDKFMLIGLVILSAAEAVSHWGQAYPDSPDYIATAHFFQGGKALTGSAQFRLLRPVVPFFASLLNYFTDIRTSFAVVNLVLWCAAAVLMFYFTKMLTQNSNVSLLSAALFASAIPMLLFADAVLTDMAGYFFILLGLYLVIRWDLPRATLQRVCVSGLVMAAGLLSREIVATVLVFALVWTILSKGSIARLVLFLAIAIGISILWSFAVGVSYVAWYNQGGLAFAAANQHLSVLARAYRILGSIQYGFGRYPEVIILAILGLLSIKSKDYLKTHISIWISAFAVILAWPIVDTRFSFILFSTIFPLAGAGFQEAYDIVFKSRLVSIVWPTFRDTHRSRLVFLLLFICAYVIITNVVLRGYFSFPWRPYTDPSISLADIH